jgi:hypothetical protein
MEIYMIEKDIPTFFIKARSFPEGVMEAWQQLHKKFPQTANRRFFGISWKNKDHIIQYLAAAERLTEEESIKIELESFIIPKGPYRSQWIRNYNKHHSEFERVFAEMLKDPELDPNGFCLEIYEGTDDALCLVKLNAAS